MNDAIIVSIYGAGGLLSSESFTQTHEAREYIAKELLPIMEPGDKIVMSEGWSEVN